MGYIGERYTGQHRRPKKFFGKRGDSADDAQQKDAKEEESPKNKESK